MMKNNYNGSNRRQYLRVPFQKTIKYRICYERFASEIIDANTNNISQGGILFKTKYPPATSTIVSLNVSPDKLKEYLVEAELTDLVDPEKLFYKGQAIFGEVVRVIKDSQSEFYSVAVKLVLQKDPTAVPKIEEINKKVHPQYIDPSIVPNEEKYENDQNTTPHHPQYIDPSIVDED